MALKGRRNHCSTDFAAFQLRLGQLSEKVVSAMDLPVPFIPADAMSIRDKSYKSIAYIIKRKIEWLF